MKNIRLIIAREYLTRIRNKSFIIMTFLTPFLLVLFCVIVGLLTQLNSDETKLIVVLDDSQTFSASFESDRALQYVVLRGISLDIAKEQAISQGAFGLLYLPQEAPLSPRFFSDQVPSLSLTQEMQNAITDAIFEKNIQQMGLSVDTIKQAKPMVSISYETFLGESKTEHSSEINFIFGSTLGYLLMLFITIYGSSTMRSVIEEKTSRIVEIIISSVKPFELMLGKIMATSLVGITQFFIWLTTIFSIVLLLQSFAPAYFTPYTNLMSQLLSELQQMPLLQLGLGFFAFFLGGYLLYGAMFVAVGAAVDSESDSQQFVMVLSVPLFLAIYVGFFILGNAPHGVISVALSYIPLTSPIIMMMRIPFGVSWGEIFLSVSILYLSFLGMIRLAGKIYRIGILTHGKKPTYAQLYHWLFLKE